MSLPAQTWSQELAEVTTAGALSTTAFDRHRMAHDASHYLSIPQGVVTARSCQDVVQVMRVAQRHGLGVTFRSGGTSLSGQAGTSGLLVDTRRHFRGIEVLDGGGRVRCEPGATVRSVNARLAPSCRALGPDPASEFACTVGGVVANNSSGMACGVAHNTYRTLDALHFVLPSGVEVDTAQPDADARLRQAKPLVWQGLMQLRDRVRGDSESVRRLRHQFSMKNTMGYGLNSFLDYDAPAEILAHLMVGSEGTLGWVASATFRSVPVHAHVATALLTFNSLHRATEALTDVLATGVRTAELMDSRSLKVAQAGVGGRLADLHQLQIADHTALLVELQEASPDELARSSAALEQLLHEVGGLLPTRLSSDPAYRAAVWGIRKGLYAAVAGDRAQGTTALLEDVVVPPAALGSTVRELQELCSRFGYDDAVIFGHARDANLHFMISPDLHDQRQVRTYEDFTEELVDLVLQADGSLKAEHGTGRMMTPFVRRQYGAELHEVMVELKRLVDPAGVLNPGVIVGAERDSHLHDLKLPQPVAPEVDRCVECGYCEPVCPSRDLTTTPRQRIALLRDVPDMTPADREAVLAEYQYAGEQTCAVDSMCASACPVGIDTGVFIKSRRDDRNGPLAQHAGALAARAWRPTLAALRSGVRVVNAWPTGVGRLSDAARQLFSNELVPKLGPGLPAAGASRQGTGASSLGYDVIFFPSCVGEVLGASRPDALGAGGSFIALCDRVGIRVFVPQAIGGLCCGTIWRSKGLTLGGETMASATAESLLSADSSGRLPIVSDASSCTHGLRAIPADLREHQPDVARQLEPRVVMDSTAYIAEQVLPRLQLSHRLEKVVVHATCADRAEGTVEALRLIASECAQEAVFPSNTDCCGFAGDRGLLHPELTAAATAAEAAEVMAAEADAYVSSNRTCELGMSHATGRPYQHVLELLEQLTRQAE